MNTIVLGLDSINLLTLSKDAFDANNGSASTKGQTAGLGNDWCAAGKCHFERVTAAAQKAVCASFEWLHHDDGYTCTMNGWISRNRGVERWSSRWRCTGLVVSSSTTNPDHSSIQRNTTKQCRETSKSQTCHSVHLPR